MITFKRFLNGFKKKYVALYFTEETEANLKEFASRYGFDLSKDYNGSEISSDDFKFHTTVFYTESIHNTPEQEVRISPIKLTPVGLELFGPEKNIPVIRLKVDEDLMRVREIFVKQGYRDSWSNYKPHITLAYNFKNHLDINKIPLPTFDIIAEKFIIENQK